MVQGPLPLGARIAIAIFAFWSVHALSQTSERGEPAVTPASPLPALVDLQSQGARIGNIDIVTVNVFDLSDPADNKGLFRLANRLHILTKPEVVRQQLLFATGEPLSVAAINETERLLRANTYLVDAQITPQRYADGTVDLQVRTQDVWTLNPGVNLSRSGGKNTYSFYVQESNLLGYGKDVAFDYESEVDRSTVSVRYSDPHLLGSWNKLLVAHADNSDGLRSELSLWRPFYSLQSKWSAATSLLKWERVDKRYDRGEVVDQYRREIRSGNAFFGRSGGVNNGRIGRWSVGISYAENSFEPDPGFPSSLALPESMKLIYPFVGFEWLEDRFEESVNETQIGRTEDLYRGRYLQAVLGWSAEAWGADRNAVLLGLFGGSTWQSQDRRQTVLWGAGGSGRLQRGRWVDVSFSTDLQAYWRISERQQIFGSLHGTVTKDMDGDRQLLLGGDFAGLTRSSLHNPAAEMPLVFNEESLRGYPLRYQDGSAMALMTLEHRLFTDYYWFRLFRVGTAAFFDVGRTWGRGTAGGESLGWLKDVGFGLRLGSTRSAFGNVIHIDVAFPLDRDESIDSVQFLVQTKRSF